MAEKRPAPGKGGRLLAAVGLTALVMASCTAGEAFARVSPGDYRDIGVTVPENARLPLSEIVKDEHGAQHSLRDLISRPTVLLFTDYTCRTLCGPIVEFAAAALEQSGLEAGRQFQLLSVGLNPKDGGAQAAEMRRDHLKGDVPLSDATQFVSADEATVARLTRALGYRYQYDAEDDQYIHPAAAFVLRADGAVSRVLTGIGLSGVDIRLALVEAGEGKIGTFRDRIRLLCSHFDPIHAAYDVMVSRTLMVTGAATIVLLGGGIGLLLLMGRRRAA